MPETSLIFACPSCGVRLTVPSSSAGVVGPCPYCRQSIRAPHPQAPAAVIPPPPQQITPALVPRIIKPRPETATPPPPTPLPTALFPQVAFPYAAMPMPAAYSRPLGPPAPAPVAVAYVPQPASSPVAYPASQPLPTGIFHPNQTSTAAPYIAPAAASPAQAPAPGPGIGRATPSAQGHLHRRKQSEANDHAPAGPQSQRPRYAANPIPARVERRPILPRVLIPILFIAAVVAVIFGLKQAIEKQQETTNTTPAKTSENDSREQSVIPEDHIPTQTPKPVPKPVAPEPAQTPPPTLPASTPAPVPSSADSPPLGVRGLALLEQFLAAKTLEERLPLLESKADPETLVATSLARELPEHLNIETDIHVPNRAENFVDLYYNVDFQSTSEKPNLQTIVVRLRGAQEPKVLADPFLDLFDGRLASFAAEPAAEEGFFQAIISIDAFCWDDHVPNSDKKLTLKLFSRGNTQEIARAYLPKQSPIGTMLESDASSELSYGQAKPATVLLRWNLTEDPKKPYLEAVSIKAFHWNP